MCRRFLIFVFLLLFIPPAFAQDVKTQLVLDMPNQAVLPKRFRTALQPLPQHSSVSLTGLRELPIAGTAQFSEQALLEISKKFTPPFIIVDLRQESHGFIDGNAVSWYNREDNANQHKSPRQVEQVQQELLSHLKRLSSISVIADPKHNPQQHLQLKNRRVISEAQLAQHHQLGYQRFYVTDHYAPNNEEIDRFIQFISTLPKHTKLLFHCRGGAGRTTTFMIMYDMFHNAKQVSFEDIIKRQGLIGGEDLLALPPSNDYRYFIAKQRLDFLRQFYQYCRTNHDNYQTLWSSWEKKQRKLK